jgi:predicted permease
MLSTLSGFAGLLVSPWTSSLLLNFNPLPSVAIEFDLGVDRRAVGFSLLASLLAGLLLGLGPAVQTWRSDLVATLKSESRQGGAHTSRLRNGFIIAQVALSLVLLIGAGLLIRSLRATQAVDPGFDPRNVFAMDFDMDLKGLSPDEGKLFYQTMVERIAQMPGVIAASLADRAPLDISTPTSEAIIEGHAPAGKSSLPISSHHVGPGYFETMKIGMVKGRSFDERDRDGAPDVAVINEAMARRYWPGQEVIGKRFRLAVELTMGTGGQQVEVIGVAKDAKYRTLGEEPTPHLYRPFLQDYRSGMTLLVRSAGDVRQTMRQVRGELLLIDKDPQGFFARTMDEHIGVALAPARIAAMLAGVFGLLALVLASVGLYGIISYSVSRRTHEIGVRLALGAEPRKVFSMVVGQGVRLVSIGVAIGLIVAFASTRLIASVLAGVSATDPLTFILAPLLLTVVAVLACIVPARRATKVDPMVALRYE